MHKSVVILFSVAACALVGCGKGFTASNSVTTPPGVAVPAGPVEATNANTCVVTRPGGVLDDGIAGSTSVLNPEILTQADQSIYISGTFPADHYVIHREFTAPSREALLAHARAYKWEIGPAKDAGGQWTKLSVWKEVLNPENNEAYSIDVKVFDYGDAIAFVDADAHLNIQCNIPKK